MNARNAKFLARNPDALADLQRRIAEQRGEAGSERIQELEMRFNRSEAARVHGLNDDDMVLLTGATRDDVFKQAELVAKYKAAAGQQAPATGQPPAQQPAQPPAQQPEYKPPIYDAVPTTPEEQAWAEASQAGWGNQ